MVVCLTRLCLRLHQDCALLWVICQHELQMFQGQSTKSTCLFSIKGETFQFKPLNLHKDLNKQPKPSLMNDVRVEVAAPPSLLSQAFICHYQLHHLKSAGGRGEALTCPSIRPGWSLLRSHHVTFTPHMYIVKQPVKKTVIGFWRLRHGNLLGLRMWAGSRSSLESTCRQCSQ